MNDNQRLAVGLDSQLPHTYASTQATKCAGCGQHKHTPLRIDAMGGYVCLTCIDQKLGSMLGEFGYPDPQASAVQSQAALDIAAERRRQVDEEGFDPAHDDEHDNGELADAAACYALGVYSDHPSAGVPGDIPPYWPWDETWWAPKDRRRNLVRAAALLMAEIERLDRKSSGA